MKKIKPIGNWTESKLRSFIKSVVDPSSNSESSLPSIGARVYNSTAQSIPNNTVTLLNFNTERFDTDELHDETTNNTRLICTQEGYYLIGANIQWASNSAGFRQILLKLNGTTEIAAERWAASASGALRQNISAIYELDVGDYVQVEVHQSSGVALNVDILSNYSPEFWMFKLGDIV